VIPETAYYSRIDCHDPNDGNAVTTKGELWSFHAFDPASEVEAGKKLFVRLLCGELPLVIPLDATITDEGESNSIELYWSVESAPDGITDDIVHENTIEDPHVLFPTTGKYTLRLDVSDDSFPPLQSPPTSLHRHIH